MVGMRERAQILGGTLEMMKPSAGGAGTLVRLRIPRAKAEAHGGA